MSEPVPRPRRRRAPRWFGEATLVLVSAALGFGAAQFGEYRSDRHLAGRILRSLQAEVEHNLAALEPLVPLHETWVSALNEAVDGRIEGSGLDVYFATRPPLPAVAPAWFPFLRRNAWEAAVAGGALRLIDYDVAAAASEIYLMQEVATGNVARLAGGALASPATYDPASRRATTRLLWLTLADIASAESLLLDLYRRHLPALRRAADAADR